jgi:hypothetical protein
VFLHHLFFLFALLTSTFIRTVEQGGDWDCCNCLPRQLALCLVALPQFKHGGELLIDMLSTAKLLCNNYVVAGPLRAHVQDEQFTTTLDNHANRLYQMI